MPHIEGEYRVKAARESRSISGFSMGGGMAFMYAVKHAELFASVIAYAGTYHRYFHEGSRTVGEVLEKAAELFEDMMRENRLLEEGNILYVIWQNAEKIRGKLQIAMHIGASDVLLCDNEIVRLYLNSLNIPHTYTIFDGV